MSSSPAYRKQLSRSSRSSRRSDESYESTSTAPTSIHDSPRPSSQHSHLTSFEPKFAHVSYDVELPSGHHQDPRSSAETYASTIQEDLYDEPEDYDDLDEFEYDLPEDIKRFEREEVVEHRATSSQDFAQYFPSQRRLRLHHDETAPDGNMNLRIETEVSCGSRKIQLQLFHLRMHDLKTREFSLRRYCRESGREVCNSKRRYAKPASQRPGIQRSVSSALALLKPDFKRINSAGSIRSTPHRKDSGYGSGNEDEDDVDEVEAFMAPTQPKPSALQIPTNTTKLEFANYAQIDVKRRGANSSKRYEFEFWGSSYRWQRVVECDNAIKSVKYHLVKEGSKRAIAHIVPELRTPAEIEDGEAAGEWVPPCSVWISDPDVLSAATDVGDVIIATGLITLVDDCIKQRTHSQGRRTRHLTLPLTPLKLDMEYIGPKAIMNHMFRRRSSGAGAHKEDGYEHKQSPLRFNTRAS